MIKILVGVAFGLLGAAVTSGCAVHSEPVVVVREPVVVRPAPKVVVRPAPVVVYQPIVVVEDKHKHKHRHKHGHGHYWDDQGENEQ